MESSFDESYFTVFDGLTVAGLPVSQIIFTASDAGSLYLENIELGNIEQIKTGQIEQSNLGGEVSILKQSYWPTIYRLSYRLNNIDDCPSDREIIEYLASSVGQVITLLDHTGIYWSGCITTPQSELTINQKHSIVIDFEGIKVG
ncbi:MAG: hypothetical protein QQN41_02685 [Nitrosopumilus sp.]